MLYFGSFLTNSRKRKEVGGGLGQSKKREGATNKVRKIGRVHIIRIWWPG